MTHPKNSESVATEARIQEAIRALKKDSKLSIRKAAKDFNIPRQSLKNRLDGKKPRNKAQEDRMNLTLHEESELVH